MSDDRTPAEQARFYVMGRIIRDPRICYLMGPGSEAYRLLTDVVGELRGEGGDAYRDYIGPTLQSEPVIERSQYDALRAEYGA
jgi:hypothetical protein